MTDSDNSRTILFVDDENNILSSLKRLFRPKGYKIFVASSGAEGLGILESQKVDVVVSDMRMPEMDGAQFLEQVSKKWPNTIRILLTGYADINATIDSINKGNIYRYISKPWQDNDITLTIENALEHKFLQEERDRLLELTNNQNKQLKLLNKQLDDKVKARTEELEQTMAHLEVTHDSLKRQYMSTVKIFTNLIEMRVGTMPGHYRRVADISRVLAKEAGLDSDQIQSIMFAALLLDLGKIGLPDNLIKIPAEKVSSLDRPKYEKYPIMGEAALMALEPLHDAAKIIRSHTENYNGSGFPDSIKGNDIPIGSRIIAIANDYELLINGTLLQRRLTPKEARDYIARQRSKKYDPVLVDKLIPRSPDRDNKKHKEDYYFTTKEDYCFTTTKHLKPGMIIGKDFVLDNDGMLLIARGQVLNEKLIAKIQELEKSVDARVSIYIKNIEAS